jgi:hypothetical protein
MCGTKECRIKFRGSSGFSSGVGWLPSPGVPPKIELEILVAAPVGEVNLDSLAADVEAKREETDALWFRYGRVAIEDATACGSVLGRVTGGRMVGVLDDPGGSKGESL